MDPNKKTPDKGNSGEKKPKYISPLQDVNIKKPLKTNL